MRPLFIFWLVVASCANAGPHGDICKQSDAASGLCGTACSNDGECGNALYCSNGACVGDCTAGYGCTGGQMCGIHGRCTFVQGDAGSQGCKNLQCQQLTCANGGTTSISGTVFDPAGKVPLYNVVVYVPNDKLLPITQGVSCEKCNSSLSGSPIVSALTDTTGHFKIDNVPAGNNIPVVIQIGKWRKQFTLPKVMPCVDTPTDPAMTRLPSKQSEGDMPKIALTTGGADALECLLRKIGIDQSEFTLPAGKGRVNFFAGVDGTNKYSSALGGGSFTASKDFWQSYDGLKPYDIVLLSCEGAQNPSTKGANATKAMFDYASAGGRVFASHWHNYWLESGPQPWPTVAAFDHQSDIGNITAGIDTTFPKGKALADWMLANGGSTALAEVAIKGAQHTVNLTHNPPAQRWIFSNTPISTQYFTFNTPIGMPADSQCGRVVFSDIHVSSGIGDTSSPTKPFPSGCTTTDLSPQEKVLEFMLFDLSSCIIDDSVVPTAPIQ